MSSDEEKIEKPKRSLRELTIEEIISSEVKYVAKLRYVLCRFLSFAVHQTYSPVRDISTQRSRVQDSHVLEGEKVQGKEKITTCKGNSIWYAGGNCANFGVE